MSGVPPAVVCLTPTWNEAWILEHFLSSAARWADRIIIADQGSDDGSAEIARRHPKVLLIENRNGEYDEGARQRLLIDAARTIPGPRVLVAIDADEALTTSVCDSNAWRAAISAPPGTVLRMPLVNLLPGLREAWVPPEPMAVGLVDDERPHTGGQFHSRRIPVAPDAAFIDLPDVALLHYQYLDPERMRAKQRWYQSVERVTFPGKRPAEIYRQYHYMDDWGSQELRPIASSWLEADGTAGIQVLGGGDAVWNKRVLALMDEHGADAFRKVDVWDVDWAAEADRLGVRVDPGRLSVRRSPVDRAVLRWLRFAQSRRRSTIVRAVSRGLKVVGW